MSDPTIQFLSAGIQYDTNGFIFSVDNAFPGSTQPQAHAFNIGSDHVIQTQASGTGSNLPGGDFEVILGAGDGAAPLSVFALGRELTPGGATNAGLSIQVPIDGLSPTVILNPSGGGITIPGLIGGGSAGVSGDVQLAGVAGTFAVDHANFTFSTTTHRLTLNTGLQTPTLFDLTGNTWLSSSVVASATDFLRIDQGTTASPLVTLTATGSDANVFMTLRTKGNGFLSFQQGTDSNISFFITDASSTYFLCNSLNRIVTVTGNFVQSTGAVSISGPTSFGTLAIANKVADGLIGTAAATVDVTTAVILRQTTSGRTLWIPYPTLLSSHFFVVTNGGSVAVTVSGANAGGTAAQGIPILIPVDTSAIFTWDTTTATWNPTAAQGPGLPANAVQYNSSPAGVFTGNAAMLFNSTTTPANLLTLSVGAQVQNLYDATTPTSGIWLEAGTTAVAKNNIKITNAATGGTPLISSVSHGADANVGMSFQTLGNGPFSFKPSTNASNIFSVSNAASSNLFAINSLANTITTDASTLELPLILGDFGGGGSIGSAASTVDIKTSIYIAQITPGQTLSLPTPSLAVSGRMVRVTAIPSAGFASVSFVMHGLTINANSSAFFVWDNSGGLGGSAWRPMADGIGISSGVSGAVQISDGAGRLTSDASNFSFDTTNHILTVGTGGAGGTKTQRLLDTSGRPWLLNVSNGSPTINYFQITNAASANIVVFESIGGDPDVNILYRTAGVGAHVFRQTTDGAGGHVILAAQNSVGTSIFTVNGTTLTAAVIGSLTQSTGSVNLASAGASSWSVTGGGLTISTVTSGALALTSVAALTLTGTAASVWSVTNANLTVKTVTGGTLLLDSAGAVNIGTGASSIGIGQSGITTTITGALTQLTGAFSFTGSANSTVQTTGAGNTLSILSADLLTITAVASSTWRTNGASANLTISAAGATSNLIFSATGTMTATSTGTSSWANTSGSLTFSTVTTGAIVITPVQALTLTAGAASTWSTTANNNLTITAGGTATLALDSGGAGTATLGATNATTTTIGNTANTATNTHNGTTSSTWIWNMGAVQGLKLTTNVTHFGNGAGAGNTANAVAIGDGALSGGNGTNDVTAIGHQALKVQTSGSNTAVGSRCLSSATTANSCTGVGIDSIADNVSGTNITAVGINSARHVTTSNNTAFGAAAMSGASMTGGGCIAIGASTLSASSVSASNCIVIGNNGLNNVTSGSNNIGIGDSVSQNVSTGSSNISIGSNSGPNASNAVGRIAIGVSVSSTVDNGVFFPTTMATVGVGNAVNFSGGQIGPTTSSRRYKKEIVDIEVDSALIYQMRPVSFTWDIKDQPNTRDFGLIAEEVDEIVPMLVPKDLEGRPNGVNYDRITVLLIAEVRKLRARIEQLETTQAA